MTKDCKYRHFYYWENLITMNENITEGYFRNIPLSSNSVFLNTVIVNCKTNNLYDWWVCYPDAQSALGFIQNVFLTSAFDAYLSPEQEEIHIITDTLEEVLEAVGAEENVQGKECIPEIKEFAEEIDKLWEHKDEELFDYLKEYSNRLKSRYGSPDNVFFYFNAFKSVEEVGNYVIKEYEDENMLIYFTEETGLTKEEWGEICSSVKDNCFMRRTFMDILNHKLCKIL